MLETLRALVVPEDEDAAILTFARHGGWRRPRHGVDGAQATRALVYGRAPDLMLLNLPRLQTAEFLLRQIRSEPRFRRTAVVVVGSCEDRGPDRDSSLPGEVWLQKPFDTEDLLNAVRLAWARTAQQSSLEPQASGGHPAH